MALQTINNRNVLKRTDSAGVVPTIPDASSVTSVTDHTLGGWLVTDIYDGEMYLNTADKKAWIRLDNEIVLIGYSGMTSNFVDLQDAPNTYLGYENQFLVVNSAATALSYAAINIPTMSTNFVDMPQSLSTYEGYVLSVDSSETGYTLIPAQKTFLQLSDVEVTGYTVNNLLQMNTTGVTSVDGATLFVDKVTDQVISGTKTFYNDVWFGDGIIVQSVLTLSGVTEVTNVTNISTDTGFTGANDQELATSAAIKAYVSNELLNAAGISGYTGNYLATNTIATQTVVGQTNFVSSVVTNFTGTTLTTNNATVGTGLTMAATSYQYWGDPSVTGCYRMYINPEGNLCIDKLISGGTWEFRADF